ncbi:hypothetical protein JCM10908_000944 [Rhodotorula pacifica]|uniref:glycoside hydrolase family 18 protein n=1 Tax=Rhodotorula pacifica TaxID=1495444 RepID=UPI0031716E26
MRLSLAACAALATAAASVVSAAAPILGQYWPAYNSEKQAVSQIPWSYSSKNGLVYYFVTVTDRNGFSLPSDQPESDIKAFVNEAKRHRVRPVFSVCGWSGSIYFSDLVSTAAKRVKFAQQLKGFMDKYGFEGVDLDWEYPNGEGIGCNKRRPSDSANLLSFLKVLRAEIGPKKLITAAVSTSGFLGPDGKALSSFAEFGKALDFINLMTYDVAASWSPTTGPNAPLRKCNSDSSDWTAVKLWTLRGFPASKILLGIPAYAISFTTNSSTLATVSIDNGKWQSKAYQAKVAEVPQGAPDDSNAPGKDECGNESAGYSGQWQYKELVSNGLLTKTGYSGGNGYHRYWDACTAAPFLFNPSKKHYISYEDSKSAGLKAKWAMQQGLAGVFIFDSTGFDATVYDAITAGLYSRKTRRL